MIKVDTKNILFICGGAFDGVDKIISRRMNTQVIGYSNGDKIELKKENVLKYVTHKDLKSFGLIPELLGRVPVLTYLEPLDKETLINILVAPKNALVKQYTKLFDLEGIKLTFTEEALEFIAEKALEYKLGARGLRSICEAILTDAMYSLPSDKNIKEFVVTKDLAEGNLSKTNLNKLYVA
jgi:ATP-dependent Clp protease ATP-binding subunit ClpX